MGGLGGPTPQPKRVSPAGGPDRNVEQQHARAPPPRKERASWSGWWLSQMGVLPGLGVPGPADLDPGDPRKGASMRGRAPEAWVTGRAATTGGRRRLRCHFEAARATDMIGHAAAYGRTHYWRGWFRGKGAGRRRTGGVRAAGWSRRRIPLSSDAGRRQERENRRKWRQFGPQAAVDAPATATPVRHRGCIGGEATSEAAPGAPPQAVGQAVGGGCQGGWGRLLSVTYAIEAGACRQGDAGWGVGRAPWKGVGVPPPLPMHACPCLPFGVQTTTVSQ